MVGMRTRDVTNENAELHNIKQTLQSKIRVLKQQQKGKIDRNVHDKIVNEIQNKCRTVKQALVQVTTQQDALETEN